jgi:RHS repeat-associated protein
VETVVNNLRFPGQYYDAETGLHYNFHRYYDPVTGRYTQADPIGFLGGDLNLYGYVGNNPVNRIDTSGLRVINNSQSTIAIVVNKSPGLPQCIFYLKPGQDTDTVLPGWDTDGIYFFHSDDVFKMYDGVTTTVSNPYISDGLKTSAKSFKTSFAQKHPFLSAPFRGDTEAAGWRGKAFIDQWHWPTLASGPSCSQVYPQEDFPVCSVE